MLNVYNFMTEKDIKKANIVKKKYTSEEQKERKEAFIKKVWELEKSDLVLDDKGRYVYDYDNFIRLIAWRSFVDLRLSEKNITLEYFWWEEKFDMVGFSFEKLYEDLNAMVQEIWVNNVIDGKYFSFHLPLMKNWEAYLQGFRGLLKTSIDGNEMTIRKLTTPRNNLDEFIFDKKLIEIVLTWVLSRKGMAISWRTGSWKSTILISLFNYFNKTNYTDILLDEIRGVIYTMLWEQKQEESRKKGKVNSKTLEFIKKTYHSIENIDLIKEDIFYCLEVIRKFIFKNFSRKWEILSAINIIRTIKIYIEKSKNEKIKYGWEVILSMFNEFESEINRRLLEAENSTINQAIKKFSLSKIRNITTLEEPIEYIYGKEGILRFYQHSLSQHFDGQYFEFINQILRDNPHVCYIAEVRNSEEIDTFLTSMSLGISSVTTCHSYDSIEVLLKFIDLSKKGWNEVMNILSNSYHTWINIESYFFTSLKDVQGKVNGFIQWYDYLDFSDTMMTTAFRNYYKQGQLWSFITQLYVGYKLPNWNLAYYPKKYTLFFRLMLLYNEVTAKKDELEGTGFFDYKVFMEELIDLVNNTKSFVDANWKANLSSIYDKEITDKIMWFIRDLETYPAYMAKKAEAAKNWLV